MIVDPPLLTIRAGFPRPAAEVLAGVAGAPPAMSSTRWAAPALSTTPSSRCSPRLTSWSEPRSPAIAAPPTISRCSARFPSPGRATFSSPLRDLTPAPRSLAICCSAWRATAASQASSPTTWCATPSACRSIAPASPPIPPPAAAREPSVSRSTSAGPAHRIRRHRHRRPRRHRGRAARAGAGDAGSARGCA